MQEQSLADRQPQTSLIDGLGEVTTQILLFSGADDFVCDVEAAKFLHEEIASSAKHIVYEECGHMPCMYKRLEFYKDLLKFL